MLKRTDSVQRALTKALTPISNRFTRCASANNTHEWPSAPGKIPLVGHMRLFTHDPGNVMTDLSEITHQLDEWVFWLQLTNQHVAVCGDTGIVEYMLSPSTLGGNCSNFVSRGPLSEDAHGLVFGNGDGWEIPRQHAQQGLLKKSFLGNATREMDEQVKDTIVTRFDIESHELNVSEAFRTLLMAINTTVSFGQALGGSANTELTQALVKASEGTSPFIGIAIPYDTYFPNSNVKEWKASYNTIVEAIDPFVDEAIERTQQQIGNDISPESVDVKSFLDMFALAHVCGGLARESVATRAVDMFLAGGDTTIHTLAFVFGYLAMHPNVQEEAAEEALRVLAGARGNELTYDLLNDCTYIDAVIKESLRLSPPASIFSRRAVETDSFAGNDILPDYEMWISPYLLGRNPKYWDNPLSFDPSRFVENRRGSLASPVAWVPFGLGMRHCIGYNLAMSQMRTIVVRLLGQFKFSLRTMSEDPTESTWVFLLRPKNDVVLRVDGRH